MHRANSFAIRILALTAAISAPALANDKNQDLPTPVTFQAVLDCKPIADQSARLACYDQKVAALTIEVRDHQLVIVDRETMREARRGLFGLSLPRLKLFGAEGEVIKEIESTIKAVRSSSDGMPIFVLTDDSRWEQTDGRHIYPEDGDKIRIFRAALGSFMASVNKQQSVRVVRLTN